MADYTWEIEFMPAEPEVMPEKLPWTNNTLSWYRKNPNWAVLDNGMIQHQPSAIEGDGNGAGFIPFRKLLREKYCQTAYSRPGRITIRDEATGIVDIWEDQDYIGPIDTTDNTVDVIVWGKGIFYLILGLLAMSFFF